jgi:hypothetical protein
MKQLLRLISWLCLFVAGRLWAQGVPAELISYPETIFHNGKVVTMNDAGSIAQAKTFSAP